MKSFRSEYSPFNERVYYTRSDIEKICSQALVSVDLLPSNPSPIRIERFIEKRFRLSPKYEDLGIGVLGMAKFSRNGIMEIIVSTAIDDSSTSGERRVKSTLAHEAGHGLLHSHLFALKLDSLFENNNNPSQDNILCRDTPDTPDVTKYNGQWWEYQANRAIGALLMPRQLVMKAVERHLIPQGKLAVTFTLPLIRNEIIKEIAEVFEVNSIVAEIRCAEMYPASENQRQLSL